MGAEQLSSTHEFLDLRRAPCLAARIGEMGSIIGQDGVDLVGQPKLLLSSNRQFGLTGSDRED